MRLDHFSVVDIMFAKCKIQHFTNHWPSVNQRDAANRFIVISKRQADIRPLGNRHKPNIRPMFCATRELPYLERVTINPDYGINRHIFTILFKIK